MEKLIVIQSDGCAHTKEVSSDLVPLIAAQLLNDRKCVAVISLTRIHEYPQGDPSPDKQEVMA